MNLEFFENYNIFILASDDNTDPYINYGATFTGCYIEGLGEQKRARKLVENLKDGFMTGNNENNNTKKLFNFYKNKINELKQFFGRNKYYIDNIRKGLNVDNNLNEIIKDIDEINEKHLREGSIDNELRNSETTRETNVINTNIISDAIFNENNNIQENQIISYNY